MRESASAIALPRLARPALGRADARNGPCQATADRARARTRIPPSGSRPRSAAPCAAARRRSATASLRRQAATHPTARRSIDPKTARLPRRLPMPRGDAAALAGPSGTTPSSPTSSTGPAAPRNLDHKRPPSTLILARPPAAWEAALYTETKPRSATVPPSANERPHKEGERMAYAFVQGVLASACEDNTRRSRLS